MSAAQRHAAACHVLLMARFPRAFPKDYDAILPLKLDIDADLCERLIQQGEPVDPDLRRRVLGEHPQRQQNASTRYRPHRTLEQQQQAVKAARIAERERGAAEEQRRREENERNRLWNLECKAAQRTGGPMPWPAAGDRKRRRVEPKASPGPSIRPFARPFSAA